MDFKRVIYLLLIAMSIGLVQVYLRTEHTHAIYEATRLELEQQQIKRQLWRQQVRLSHTIRSPQCVKSSIERLGVDVCPPQGLLSEDEQKITRH